MEIWRWLSNPQLMVEWVREKATEFVTLPARIAALRTRAQQVKELLDAKGDAQAAANVQMVQSSLTRIQGSHQSMRSRFDDLLSKLGALGIQLPGLSAYHQLQAYHHYGGLGIIPAIPVALVVAGSAVALGIAALFSDFAKQQNLLKAIEEGRLTPEEAKALGAGKPLFGLDLGKLALPALLIGGALMFGPQLLRGARR